LSTILDKVVLNMAQVPEAAGLDYTSLDDPKLFEATRRKLNAIKNFWEDRIAGKTSSCHGTGRDTAPVEGLPEGFTVDFADEAWLNDILDPSFDLPNQEFDNGDSGLAFG